MQGFGQHLRSVAAEADAAAQAKDDEPEQDAERGTSDGQLSASQIESDWLQFEDAAENLTAPDSDGWKNLRADASQVFVNYSGLGERQAAEVKRFCEKQEKRHGI